MINDLETLQNAINEIYNMLTPGPCSVTRDICDGCTWEWMEALRIVTDLRNDRNPNNWIGPGQRRNHDTET